MPAALAHQSLDDENNPNNQADPSARNYKLGEGTGHYGRVEGACTKP